MAIFLVQLADLLLEELQLLQHHLQKPSVHGLEVRAGTERITQLFRCGAQLSIGQSGQSCRIGFSVSRAFSMRWALRPSRSETRLDNLMWASSRRDSNWFCSRTRSRVNWYFRRVTVRHKRCSASGTKLRVNSRATSRFTKRSASGKSLLRPCRPRLDCASAKCSVPDLRRAPSRFSRIGFQYLSSASHTGFQYCAVDSMTTSSASCSTSHAASVRSCSGLLPNIRRSNRNSPSTSTSDTTTANTFL